MIPTEEIQSVAQLEDGIDNVPEDQKPELGQTENFGLFPEESPGRPNTAQDKYEFKQGAQSAAYSPNDEIRQSEIV